MKKVLLALLMTITSIVFAQTPEMFRYQATLLNDDGQPFAGNTTSIFVSILQGTQKERVYSEFHNVTTDMYGIIDLRVGMGNAVTGQFNQIEWGAGPHFIRVELDQNGGSNYKRIAEIQLLSVPYALHAGSVDNVDDADADPENEIQELSLESNMLSISNGNSIALPLNTDNQTLTLNGYELEISNGNTVQLPSEIQELSIDANILSISQSNSVELPANTDNQILSVSGNQLSISNGNTVELPGTIVPDPSEPVGVLYQGTELFVHPSDNSESVIFGEFTETGATSNFDGQANTEMIVETYGSGIYAASVCDNLSAFGFDDWYLPSRAELDAIFKQNYLITDYTYESYWSSTESSSNMAYEIDFNDGAPNDITKNQSRRVRCVRKSQ